MITENTYVNFIIEKGLEEDFYLFLPVADRLEFKRLFGKPYGEL